MRFLVFDTETTGLPNTKIINPDTLHLWPHIVQFSFVIYDDIVNDIVESKDYIIKVDDSVNISEESTNIHGITNELSKTNGIEIQHVLNVFFTHLKNVDILVGHNVTFDINMVKIELLRIIYLNNRISHKDRVHVKHSLHYLTNFNNICCTLKDSIEFCDIKAFDRYGKTYTKWPKLVELHQKLFETVPNNLHNSFNDILVTLRCFMKLKYEVDLNETCKKFKKISRAIKLL
jgi:DNA polymerase III epsilon subunit-like protein